MLDGIWGYLRRKTRSAILEGVQDALDDVETGSATEAAGTSHSLAEGLRRRLALPPGSNKPTLEVPDPLPALPPAPTLEQSSDPGDEQTELVETPAKEVKKTPARRSSK